MFTQIERGLNKLSDGRVNPTYGTGQVILPVLFGFLLRIKSLNELNLMIKNHEFRQLFPRGTKLPQIDAIRDTLKVIDINGLKQTNQHIPVRECMVSVGVRRLVKFLDNAPKYHIPNPACPAHSQIGEGCIGLVKKLWGS